MFPMSVDAVIIGGGPAGASIGRLLASWGRSVLLLCAPGDRSRGLAESLPPSAVKLLAEVGVLDAVDAAGFLRATGNTSWWASDEARIEAFDSPGYQVFRPDFDSLLLDCARQAGADVRSAIVRRVALERDGASVEYDDRGERRTITCRFVIDASGRAGIVARRYRVVDDARMFGYVGVWSCARGWDLADSSHTLVESFDDGWAWSVPTSGTTRHIGVMVGEPGATCESHIARTRVMRTLAQGARLERAFACDASTYAASAYAGPQFLLVGDAASFIDPLSSFGVKKALASAWLGAIVVHTCLADSDRREMALAFFSGREREMRMAHVLAARAFAREAFARYATPFWERRIDPPAAQSDPAMDPQKVGLKPDTTDVALAFERFKAAPSIELRLADRLPLERRPIVRGREIVLEETLAGGLRFAGNVDLLALARMAPRHRQVPDLFEAYCRDCAPVPLPSVVSGLSLLVAKGILHET